MENRLEEQDKARRQLSDPPESEGRSNAFISNFYRRLYDNDGKVDRLFNIIQTARAKPVVVETSQERMERLLHELKSMVAELNSKVATRDDVIEQTNQLLQNQKEINITLHEKLEILRSMQIANVPHKKLAVYAGSFLTFFIFSFLCYVLFDVTVVVPFWNNIGLVISFGFFVMALAMRIDWRELTGKK